MKRKVPFFMAMMIGFVIAGYGQSVRLEVPIVKTPGATIEVEIEDADGNVIDTLTVEVSHDDAEQENDAIDALNDDDLDAGWEGDPEDFNVLSTGLRFQNISIPQGSTITNAYLEVTSHEEKSAEDVALIYMYCEATDDAETFNEEDLITDRPRTEASVLWTVDEPWGLWTTEQSEDISSLIQEVVDRPGWEAGNSLAVLLIGSDEQGASEFENAREFEAFENISDPGDGGDGVNHPERVPKLVIEYVPNGPQSLTVPIVKTPGATIEVEIEDAEGNVIDTLTVEVSHDDAEQENDAIDALNDDDLDAGWEGDPEDFNVLSTGLRFQNIQIPQGATIDNAYLEVTSHEEKSAEDVALIYMYCEATDDAETFNEEDLITDRPRTEASVLWTVDEEWGLWTTEQSDDISPLIQEVVDRPGWEAGNSLAVLLIGSDEQGASEFENAREFEAFENISDPGDGGDGVNHPERVPKLVVTWSVPTSMEKKELVRKNEFNLFPNPTNGDILNITFANEEEAQIMIYNIAGRLVKSFETNQQFIRVDVSDLSEGLYLVKARGKSGDYAQKLIIQ